MAGETFKLPIMNGINRPKLVEMRIDGKFWDWVQKGENILTTTVGFHSIEVKTDLFRASINAEICEEDMIIKEKIDWDRC